VGDESVVGWIVTGAYFAAASVAIAVSRAPFHVLSSLALVALGANKQLDLQTHLFTLGRRLTFALGVYEHRDLLHVLFPIAVGLVLAVVLAVIAKLVWRDRRNLAPVLAGFVLLAAFIVVRVAFFSHLARVLGWAWLESETISLVELAAVGLIALGFLRMRTLSASLESRRDRS
jgi:hypothetical protein